jgi:hypothetical protein
LETLELHHPSLLNDIAARLHATIRQHTSAYVSIRQHTSGYVLETLELHAPSLFNDIAARLQHACLLRLY